MRLTIRKNLAADKVLAANKIDADAGQMRQLFITDAPGQGQVYSAKREEAEYILHSLSNGVESVPTRDSPHILAEATRRDLTLEAVAAEVLKRSDHWRQISAMIEERRLGAKDAVRRATCPAEIEAALVIDWAEIIALAEGE